MTANGAELAQGFWEKTPTMTWVTDTEGCLYQFGDALSGEGYGAAPSKPTLGTALRVTDIVRQINGIGRLGVLRQYPVQAAESLVGPDGNTHYFLVVRFPFSGNNGTPYIAGLALDITKHKLRVDELAHQAVVDELTGLYNRRGFLLFAEHELKAARRRGTRSTLMFIDIDGLKQINDTYGHGEGNELLARAGECLRQEFRECDVIARLGGDEFALFAPDMKGDPERLRERLCARLRQPVQLSHHRAQVSVSSGLASCGPNDGTGLADLVAAADHAMYREKCARKQGVNVWCRTRHAALR